MYPHDYRPWVNIANLDNQLGIYPPAIAAGERAMQVNPRDYRGYAVAARAYKNASRFAEAKALVAEMSRRWPDRPNDALLEVAYYEHDTATFDRNYKFAEQTQRQLRNYYLGQARSMDGKYAEATRLQQTEIAEDRRQGKMEIVDGVLVELATMARIFGYPAEASAALRQISRSYLASDDAAFEFAMNGDATYAKRYVAAHEHDPHAPTDQAVIVMPRMRAVVALREGKLEEALADLEPSRPYQMAGFTSRMLRAEIHMKLGEPEKAAEDFQSVVASPGSGFGVLYPMAKLGLARADAAAGNRAGSRAAYESFLSDWKDADPDLPLLKAAKAEFAKLEAR